MSTTEFKIPYASEHLPLYIDCERLNAVLEPNEPAYSRDSQLDIIRNALHKPVGSARLSDLASKVRKVLIITSDHTRPLPSALTLPLLLAEIRKLNQSVEIRILVATGCHRESSRQEMLAKFGQNIVDKENIIVHNCYNQDNLIYKGILPSGSRLEVNNLVDWAELLVAEGFIEPHFFAGFSGGAKSILPGISGAQTVMANHNAAFIADPAARTGNLDNNPLQKDMWYAAKACNLRFILNVTLHDQKYITSAYAGEPAMVHDQGCKFVARHASVPKVISDIVITSNGGYPLDQNIYQAVKGMTTASTCARSGGVIIIAASCIDGHGGEDFFRWFADANSIPEIINKIETRSADETLADQWQAQILAKILNRNQVILVTRDCDPAIVKKMKLEHAYDISQALAKAETIVGNQAKITVIPDGVSVIVQD